MNPLRRGDGHCDENECPEYVCLFQHTTGEQYSEKVIRKMERRYGHVRCPYEWEITAVKS